MKYKLYWHTEEEGRLVFLEKETEWLCFDIFIVGEEAELVIKGGEIVDKVEQSKTLSGKLLEQVEKCIKKVFSLLWNKGIEEVFLVEKQGELFVKLLKEANIIELVYSEYMMKRNFSIKDICQENEITLNIMEEEDMSFLRNGMYWLPFRHTDFQSTMVRKLICSKDSVRSRKEKLNSFHTLYL